MKSEFINLNYIYHVNNSLFHCINMETIGVGKVIGDKECIGSGKKLAVGDP